jgi:hypothetical protein
MPEAWRIHPPAVWRIHPPAVWRTVRVFISSTFRDRQAERDHLVRQISVPEADSRKRDRSSTLLRAGLALAGDDSRAPEIRR